VARNNVYSKKLLMNKLLIACSVVCCFASCQKDTSPIVPVGPVDPIVTDSFTVTVNNGYGTGKYKVGDTVHIWSKEATANQVFDKWTGETALLNSNDWHAWFIMPARTLIFTGSLKSITLFTLNFEMIRGRDRMKPVYSYFPAGHKGIIYLLHGTGGSAAQFTSGYEEFEVIKELVNDGFAVIITEAEEATTGVDVNGDGKLRWTQLPVDTLTNIDYVNIRNITDTFYNRGTTVRSKPRYSLGMSNGGTFSAALSYVYNFKAGISYCAPGGTFIANNSTVPLQFCMQKNDSNPDVGPQGNADALSNSGTLTTRGICSKYFINQRSPVYPERFARRSDITLTKSAAIFNELKTNGFIGAKNYFIGNSSNLTAAITAHPGTFPQLITLNGAQLYFVISEVDCCASDHHMYSDLTKNSLKFLNTQCL
jgi:hypothetical protein